jgi:signal transduction histidine kinase
MVPLLQAGAIALAIGIILSLTISRSIAQPLKKVSQASQALADGDYEVRVKSEGPLEIKRLAEGFNSMAQKIQASQQAQNDLVANVAHDLRTPLTSIQGYAQALIDGTAADPESRNHAAETIYQEARRMDKIAKTLLDLSKFQAGEIKLQIQPVDVVDLVRERMDFYHKQIRDGGLSIELQTSHESIILNADHERLIQVIDNLLSNAIAYTNVGGKISIECSRSESEVRIAISDTGVGIPQEDIPRIFERFYRSDKSRQGLGTGLGLSIVKEIVNAHDGDIVVESIVGVGTKFTINLPSAE